jgi:hypothetical protein
MAVKPLPRNPDGSLAPLTRLRQRYSMDFAGATPSRSVADAVGTSGSTTITSAAKGWRPADVGSYATGTGVGQDARVASVAADGSSAVLTVANSAAVASAVMVTAFPAWMSVLNTWGSAATIANGKLVLTDGANVSAVSQVRGPVLDLAAATYVDVTARQVMFPAAGQPALTAQLFIGVGNVTGWLTNNGEGGFLSHRQGRTEVELRAAVAETVTNDMIVLNTYNRAVVAEDFTFRIDIARKLVYGIVRGEVQCARDLSAVMVNNTSQYPIIAARGNGGVATMSGIEIDVWYP